MIRNPAGGVFAWLLSRTVDQFGNSAEYTYRGDGGSGPQRYLDQVRYADFGDRSAPSFLVVVALVYDDLVGPSGRPDPFSDRKPGFDLRTTLRARQIQVRTQPTGTSHLVSTIDLRYSDDQPGSPPTPSLLTGLTITGHDGADQQEMPPLEFGYSACDLGERRFERVPSDLPIEPLGQAGTELADLFGDGLPSVIQLNGSPRYWRNRGSTSFDPPRSMAAVVPGSALGQPGVLLTDVDGDGRADLVVSSASGTRMWSLAAPVEGRARAGFDPRSYRSATAPPVSLSDPEVRLIDLVGDHVPDMLYAGSYPMLHAVGDGAGGFGALAPLPNGTALPQISFTDPRVRTADMTGDGLTDLVLIHGGAVEYWPNLGHGRFGARTRMSGSPAFDDRARHGSVGFDPRRLLIGDVVGDGTADIVYVEDGRTTIWMNQSGNGFAPPVVLPATPRVTDVSAVRLVDLKGSGVSGILYTGVGEHHAFLDLTGGTKPYLLVRVDNHAGASTQLSYTTSSQQALSDRAAGRPWRTTLPFPVHVVSAITSTDAFADTTLTTTFTYHDGYWDPVDREFRGFGRVEQRDALTSGQPTSTEPAQLNPLDPLSPATPLRADFDATSAGNLLTNFSFDTAGGPGTSELVTTAAQPVGEGPSAARGWLVRNSVAATTATELVSSTLPQGSGGRMIRVRADRPGCGLTQVYLPASAPAPSRADFSAWVYIVRGSVRIATGDGDTRGPEAVCGQTGEWILVQHRNQDTTSRELMIVAGDPDGAEFYVDHAWVCVPWGSRQPELGPPIRTVTWFHQGPVSHPSRAGPTTRLPADHWAGDPPVAPSLDLTLVAGASRSVLRAAVRAVRGRALRSELFADDGTSRAARPYEVHDFAYQVAPVLDGRSRRRPRLGRGARGHRADDHESILRVGARRRDHDPRARERSVRRLRPRRGQHRGRRTPPP